ncbi:MAG: transcription antitermination protein NusB [Bacteroidota bacterium]|nr:transcription antitermination protein NusB [Bacteroidota bacterium]
MQSLYAMHQNNSSDLIKEEKFLLQSIENVNILYLTVLSALIEIKNYEEEFIEKSKRKHLATLEELNPNTKFINNAILLLLSESNAISMALADYKINNWKLNDDCIIVLVNEIKKSEIYQNYMNDKEHTFEKDKEFIIELFAQVIAPNERFYNYLEEHKLTWTDDIALINTQVLKQLRDIDTNDKEFQLMKLYKNNDDKEFVRQIFRKTLLKDNELSKEYADKALNWDKERISDIDNIILKMAVCEFLHFPSIPFNATINEYLEITKEYSTPRSCIFINGILNVLSKTYQENNTKLKMGRGLL